ncbi:hypothetical protein Pmani_000714 [Petrolisthes manimaculis]|uniref:Uncharacterized protein n=1 Tax=Petrolisthes manimaculis TaxID=1843537 RepID=A0AAE1QLI1_9EUCA|nr:hypothetical protein Pmani_000714 [Petrolisthes manimaculis]
MQCNGVLGLPLLLMIVVVVGEASFPGPNHTPTSTSNNNTTRIARESPQPSLNDTQGDTDSYVDDQGVQQRTESDQAAAASQDIHRTGFLLDFLMGRPRHYFRQPHPPPLPPPRRPPSSHSPPPPPKPHRHPPPHSRPPLHDVHHHHHHQQQQLDHDPSPHLDDVDFEFDFEPPDFFESSGFLHPEDVLGDEEHFHWNLSPPDHQSHEPPSFSSPHDNPFTSSLESFLDDPPHFPTGPPRPPIGSPIGSPDYSGPPDSYHSGPPPSHSGPPPSHHSGPPPSHHSGPPDSYHSEPPLSHHSGPSHSHHSGPPHSHHSGPPHSHHSGPPSSHDSDHSIHSGPPFQHLDPDSPPNHFPSQPPVSLSLPFNLNSISDSSLYRDDVPVKKVTNDRDKIHDGLNPGGVKGLDPEALLTITQFTQAYINDQL